MSEQIHVPLKSPPFDSQSAKYWAAPYQSLSFLQFSVEILERVVPPWVWTWLITHTAFGHAQHKGIAHEHNHDEKGG